MVERETGIEPALVAWKATVLPLNYSRAGSPACVAPVAGKAAGYREIRVELVEGGGFEPPKVGLGALELTLCHGCVSRSARLEQA